MTIALDVAIASKRFTLPDGTAHGILNEIRFSLAPGEFAAIVGPSGVGKTTLLNILAGIDRNFAGTVRIADAPPGAGPVGYVFQEPRLLPWRSVRDNVALVLPRGSDPAIADRLLGEVGLGDVARRYPPQLSLGMARRVALARALTVEPPLLLLDEPFVSLDAETADRLRRLLLTLWRARGCAIVLVTHDLTEAVMLADRMLVIAGSPSRLLIDMAVTLPRDPLGDRHGDPAAVEAMRAELAARLRAVHAENGVISAARDTG